MTFTLKKTILSFMKKTATKIGFAGLALLAFFSCSKKNDWTFVGTTPDSQIIMLDGKNPNRKESIRPKEKNGEEETDIVNPWANENLTGNSSIKAENGDYDRPQEISIETFRHIQRLSVNDKSQEIEQTFDLVNGNPWVTKITKNEKVLFESVPFDGTIDEKYKKSEKINGTRAVRIQGKEGSPDLVELIDDASGTVSEVIIIPAGLPELKLNEEFSCFEFSENEKRGTTGGQLYIFPTSEGKKKVNVGLVKYNTAEYSEPAKNLTGNESMAQGSEVLLIARTAEKLEFEGKTSYWFQAKRGERLFWIPGYNLYLQTGTFSRLSLTAGTTYVPLESGFNWFRISDDFTGSQGSIRRRQIVYAAEIESGSGSLNEKKYKLTYPAGETISGMYLETIEDIQGSYNLYPDNGEKEIQFATENDPYVTIYEAPNINYRKAGTMFDESNAPEGNVSIKVNGFTDIQEVISNAYGRWYSVSSPVKGFVFIEDHGDF